MDGYNKNLLLVVVRIMVCKIKILASPVVDLLTVLMKSESNKLGMRDS